MTKDNSQVISGINLKTLYGICQLTSVGLSMEQMRDWFDNKPLSNVTRTDIEQFQRVYGAWNESLNDLDGYPVCCQLEKRILSMLGKYKEQQNEYVQRGHLDAMYKMMHQSMWSAVTTYVTSMITYKPYPDAMGTLCILICNRILLGYGRIIFLDEMRAAEYRGLFSDALKTGDPVRVLGFIQSCTVTIGKMIE